jgi:hypothetical protein
MRPVPVHELEQVRGGFVSKHVSRDGMTYSLHRVSHNGTITVVQTG